MFLRVDTRKHICKQSIHLKNTFQLRLFCKQQKQIPGSFIKRKVCKNDMGNDEGKREESGFY